MQLVQPVPPALKGCLLWIGLRLQAAPLAALGRLAFLGGVLHGAVAAAQWHVGSSASEQGHDAGGYALHWRLLAPPVCRPDGGSSARVGGTAAAAPPNWLGTDGWLRFGLLVHAGGGPAQLQAFIAALAAISEIACGAERYRVLEVTCAPRSVAATLPGREGAALPGQRLCLDWITPLQLASKAQVQAGHGDAPPTLLRCVRSAAQRLRAREPEWAQACGLDSPGWVQCEEALRRAQPLSMDDEPPPQALVWRYGSRTKAAPFAQRGLVGRQYFSVPLPPALLALLAVGAWLGVGEGGGFGCGQYRWQAWDAAGQPLPQLLPSPWG